MNLYYIYFRGHWPVGAVALVMAESEEAAKVALEEELKTNHGLDREVSLDDIHHYLEDLDTEPEVVILLDGNY